MPLYIWILFAALAAAPFIVLTVWRIVKVRPMAAVSPANELTLKNLGQSRSLTALLAVLGTVFIWAWWPSLLGLWQIWMRSDEYSSGLLVAPLAVYAYWGRRNDLMNCPVRPFWPGLLLLGAVHFFRCYYGLYYGFGSIDRLTIVVGLIFVIMITMGLRFSWRIWPILGYLYLMLPLPNRVHAMIAQPLQHWSTVSAVFCLETFGYDAVRDGNVIHIGQTTVAVAEACNGLRMLTAFFVISGLVALIVRRPWWQKLVILAMTLPVGFLCNSIRLTITAIAFTFIKSEAWEKVFHDFGGYAMMPLALALVVLELWFLQKIVQSPDAGRRKKEEVMVIQNGKTSQP